MIDSDFDELRDGELPSIKINWRMKMLTVYFTNMGYASERRFSVLTDAIVYAQSVCFQAQVHNESGHLLATWCPIAGTKLY